MNRALLNPFQALTLPDELELTLVTDGKATCMAFNRHGNVLAVGCANGNIALWDFDTRRLAKEPVSFVRRAALDERAHVTAVAFPSPRTGHNLLASFAAAELPTQVPQTTGANCVSKNGLAESGAAVPPPSVAKQTAARHGLLNSDRGTGVLRLYRTLHPDGLGHQDAEFCKVEEANGLGLPDSDFGKPSVEEPMAFEGNVVCQISFDMPIVHFVAHPTRRNALIVLPANRYPLLVTISPGTYSISKDEVYRDGAGPSDVRTFLPSNDSSLRGESVGTSHKESTVHAPGAVSVSRTAFVTVAVLHQPTPLSGAENEAQGQITGPGTGRRSSRFVLDPYVVTFTPDGKQVLRGGPDGVVHVFELKQRGTASLVKRHVPDDHHLLERKAPSMARLVNSFKVQGGAAIRSLTLMKTRLLVNSADRTLRLLDTSHLLKPDDATSGPPSSQGGGAVAPQNAGALHVPSVQTIFKDAINRAQARCACFSRDGDFVLAGMSNGGSDRIVVWKTSDGQAEMVLESQSEGIVDLLWHPRQPVIASVGTRVGKVMVWAKNFTENWSAFAPEFTELDANEEYEESENEFDAKHPQNEQAVAKEREREEASNHVDVEARVCFSSDEEGDNSGDDAPLSWAENDDFFFLPAVPVPDSYMSYPTASANGLSARELLKEKRGAAPRVSVPQADIPVKPNASQDTAAVAKGGLEGEPAFTASGSLTARSSMQTSMALMDDRIDDEPSKGTGVAVSGIPSAQKAAVEKDGIYNDRIPASEEESRPAKRGRSGGGVSFAPTVDIVEPALKTSSDR